MNKRIEKLLGQALDLAVPETWTTLTPEQLAKVSEKFAELIVMECLTICEELGDKGMDGHYCADRINKTFWS